MVRAQILLKERQYEALKSRARREGKSLSQVVREAVDETLGERRSRGKKKARLEDLFGLFSDPTAKDVAINHDKYLYGEPYGL